MNIRTIDIISYVYCEERRIACAEIIEALRFDYFNSNPHSLNDERNNIRVLENGCASVPIKFKQEVEPELVYDFTTQCDNHSFVASSFVVSNCVAETPEGQSIGVVKNISYLCHITIPTNSASLYEYVTPYILSVNDTPPEKLNNKEVKIVKESIVRI